MDATLGCVSRVPAGADSDEKRLVMGELEGEKWWGAALWTALRVARWR